MVSLTDTMKACTNARVLQLVLLPTEACNFRCVYCFESFEHGRMTPTVVTGIKRFLTGRAADLSRLTLTWFGGEPLLAADIMEEILEHAAVLRRRHPDLELRSDATTNGYLLDRARFERLLALGVTHYQITFDGPRRWHDRKRVMAGGRGTFDRIWENLRAMRDVRGDFQVLVRLHADEENREELPEFIEAYAQEFGADRRFRFFLRELSRFGGANDATLPVLERAAGRRTVGDLRRLAVESGIEEHNLEHMSAICYAARANSFVIRADGRINKCSLALEEPTNQVGRITEEGEMAIDQARIKPWLRGIWDDDAAALRCPKQGLTAPGPRTGQGFTFRD